MPPGQERLAVRTDDGRMLDLSTVTPDIHGTFPAPGGIDRARVAVTAGELPELDPAALGIGAHVTRPAQIVRVDLNYRDHAAETDGAIPARPVVFMRDRAQSSARTTRC